MVLGTPCSKMNEVLRTSGIAEEKMMMVIIKLVNGSQ
jgi:hypothetical protein